MQIEITIQTRYTTSMTPEERARFRIDQQLLASGWVLQNKDEFNRMAALGMSLHLPHVRPMTAYI